jgi:hypothetical protein
MKIFENTELRRRKWDGVKEITGLGCELTHGHAQFLNLALGALNLRILL